jgi:hypothetical protein
MKTVTLVDVFRSTAVWPPVVVMIVFFIAASMLPQRITPFPNDAVRLSVTAIFALAVIASAIVHQVETLRRFDRPLAFTVTGLLSVGTAIYFREIILSIVIGGSDLKGGPLLEGAILVWLSVVMTFSLWYWLVDRGVDFFFPQEGSELYPGWSPKYLDYVALAFNTATAFSPTDVAPASHRAKVLMMMEASLSLATISIATARAINVLT